MRRVAEAVVLFCICRQHGYDMSASAFAPPPATVGSPVAKSSSPPAGLRRVGAAGTTPAAQHTFGRKHAAAGTSAPAGPLRAAAGGDGGGDGAAPQEEGEWRRFGSGSMSEEGSGAEDDGVERVALKLPEIANPFKKAFDAGQNLRSTLADTLGQITGTASPLEGVKIRSLEEYERRLYSPFDSEEEVR
ncbi:unnamed protein product [Ectocarpus sp. 12 AP-2014]